MDKDKKILFFLGAGFTASLGMPTSEQQDMILRKYFWSDVEDDFRKYMRDKMRIDDNISMHLYKLRETDEYSEKNEYDIKGLCEYVKHYFRQESFTVQQMYNLIDLHMNSGCTLQVDEKTSYSLNEVRKIRRGMIVLLQAIFSVCTQKALKNDSLDEYKLFFKDIAKKIIRRKIRMMNEIDDLDTQEFILAPVSYISTNWDVLFMWAMFCAHKELNDNNSNYGIFNGKNIKCKVFNDFATFMSAKSINIEKEHKKWFPYNESVAVRINDGEHINDRCVCLIKTYLPHGQTNWLECPVCGKLNAYLGNAWTLRSDSVVMKWKQGMEVYYPCIHCGNEITTADSSMLLQTNYKKKPPYIQEIQTDMRLNVKEADTIIFIGYSLPEDDIEYRTMFTAMNPNKTKNIYVVLYEENYNCDTWVKPDLIKGISESNKKIVNRYVEIFDRNNVYFNFQGFPAAMQLLENLIVFGS